LEIGFYHFSRKTLIVMESWVVSTVDVGAASRMGGLCGGCCLASERAQWDHGQGKAHEDASAVRTGVRYSWSHWRKSSARKKVIYICYLCFRARFFSVFFPPIAHLTCWCFSCILGFRVIAVRGNEK
jgi:hypothetical protein